MCVCVCVRARRAILWAAGIEHRDYARERAGFWDRVYGFNMRCIKKERAPWRWRIAFIAAFTASLRLRSEALHRAQRRRARAPKRAHQLARRACAPTLACGWAQA